MAPPDVSKLPLEVQIRITRHLSYKDAFSYALTCRSFTQAGQHQLWTALVVGGPGVDSRGNHPDFIMDTLQSKPWLLHRIKKVTMVHQNATRNISDELFKLIQDQIVSLQIEPEPGLHKNSASLPFVSLPLCKSLWAKVGRAWDMQLQDYFVNIPDMEVLHITLQPDARFSPANHDDVSLSKRHKLRYLKLSCTRDFKMGDHTMCSCTNIILSTLAVSPALQILEMQLVGVHRAERHLNSFFRMVERFPNIVDFRWTGEPSYVSLPHGHLKESHFPGVKKLTMRFDIFASEKDVKLDNIPIPARLQLHLLVVESRPIAGKNEYDAVQQVHRHPRGFICDEVYKKLVGGPNLIAVAFVWRGCQPGPVSEWGKNKVTGVLIRTYKQTTENGVVEFIHLRRLMSPQEGPSTRKKKCPWSNYFWLDETRYKGQYVVSTAVNEVYALRGESPEWFVGGRDLHLPKEAWDLLETEHGHSVAIGQQFPVG